MAFRQLNVAFSKSTVGGCTGLFQACNVGLQRLLKLAIRRAAHNDVVNETLAALEAGSLPGQVVNDQSRATLRNRSVNWILQLQGYHAINQPDIVTKAFKLCAVPEIEFNLSYNSLTSREARQAIMELRTSNPQVYAEITSDNQQLSENSPPNPLETNDPDSDIYDGDVEDEDRTIDELREHILGAESANAIARPLDESFEDAHPTPMLRRSARIGATRR